MPQNYTASDLKAYARSLDKLVEALPIEQAMEKGEARQLVALGQALGGAASNIRLQAIQDLLAETTEPLDRIARTTQEAQAALKKIQTVSHLIDVVGDVVVLAQVVATRNWKLVLPALNNLRKEIKVLGG